MKVVLYPADDQGCGAFRMTWPGRILAAAGHNVVVRPPKERDLKLRMDGERVVEVLGLDDVDVVVFQRLTHSWMAQAVRKLRERGIAVVVDVDDDLTTIHPRNPAYAAMHPSKEGKKIDGEIRRHSWTNLSMACRDATLVTTSTPALLEVYARHGRGHVIYNYLPDHYYGLPRADNDAVGWPAALVSHPDDPSAVCGSVARYVADGGTFRVVSDPMGVGAAFGLQGAVQGLSDNVPLMDWPKAVAGIGIGIAPLSDTRFNRCKSWLKPLELSACGVPWVGSPRAEYERLNRMGAGVLADTSRRWYRELSRLSRSPELRAEMSEAGRSVAESLRMEQNAWRWLDAWSRASDLQHGRQTAAVAV